MPELISAFFRQHIVPLAVNLANVMLSAGLIYIGQWATKTDFGAWNGIIVPLIAGAVDAGLRFLATWRASVTP